MKRFTLILASLFLSLGALNAQEVYVTNLNDLSNEKTYLIESARCVLINSANVTTGLATTNGTRVGTVAKSIDDPNQQFKIEKDGENYYLYSIGAGKYVTAAGAWSDTKGTALTITNVSGENAGYPWKLSLGSTYLNSQDPGQTEAGIIVDNWATTDPGNCYRFVDIEATKALETVDVTYTFTYGGETIGTQTTTIEKGAAYPAIDVTKYPFGFTATTPTGTVDTDTEKTIELTAAFSWADSYENITAWYYLDLKDGKYLFYEEGQTNIPLTKTSVDSNNKDAYTWGFIGDPVNGFQIVNYAAGSSMILSSTTNTFDGSQGGNTYPVMTATPVPEGNNTHWIFTASTNRENGFYIGQKDANNGANKLNNRGDILAYWNAGADAGSTFIMTERPMGPAAELEALVEEIEAMNIVAGTNIGDYTEASVNALNEAIATAKALETVTADDVAALQAALDALATVSPSADKVYAFNVYYDGFGQYLYSKIDGSTSIYTQGPSSADTKALWQFVEAEGGYNIKNVHTNLFISKSVTMTDVASEYGLFVVTKYNTENGVRGTANEGKVYIKFAGDTEQCIHSYNTATAKSWHGTGLGNQVGLEEVADFKHTLTVTNAGWATLVLGFNATIPAEVTAYTIASQEDGYVTLAEATGVLQANVPVLVEAAAGDYDFAYTTEEADVTSSGLEGTLYNKDITANAYVLGIPEGETEACFAKATTEGKAEGTFTNNANKAYFVPTNAQANIASYSFRFGEGTTGVEKVEMRNQKSEIYDLTGRRVEAITAPGIYIVGGKKVLVK